MNSEKPYMLNINHPEVEKVYQIYKKSKNIPLWCPFSESERLEFELFFMVMRTQENYENWFNCYTNLTRV